LEQHQFGLSGAFAGNPFLFLDKDREVVIRNYSILPDFEDQILQFGVFVRETLGRFFAAIPPAYEELIDKCSRPPPRPGFGVLIRRFQLNLYDLPGSVPQSIVQYRIKLFVESD
jgi:hypothetical protein